MENVGIGESSAEQRDIEGVSRRQKDSHGSHVESKIFLYNFVLYPKIQQ